LYKKKRFSHRSYSANDFESHKFIPVEEVVVEVEEVVEG
jgi:hypothetical protein